MSPNSYKAWSVSSDWCRRRGCVCGDTVEVVFREGQSVVFMWNQTVFSNSAPAEDWLVGCEFVLALHWCTEPINHCSLSRPLFIWVVDKVCCWPCDGGKRFVCFLCTFPSEILIKRRSKMSKQKMWLFSLRSQLFLNSERSWPWQGTINNYHHNVSDTVSLHVIIPPHLSFLLILAWSTFYLHLPGGPD